MPLPIARGGLPLHPPDPKTDKAKHEAELQRVAKQFEGVLVSQLLEVMWRTTSSAVGGSKGGQYQQMFQSSFADHIVSGGGIGLTKMIASGLGSSEEPSGGLPAHVLQSLSGSWSGAIPPATGAGPRTLTLEPSSNAGQVPAQGVLADLQRAATAMLDGGGSERWSRDGTLTPADLASDFTTAAPGGEARFSVRDANGYQGYYKCNLFAFEMARRAGLQVPVVAREAGWGFPSSNRVTQDASDGSLAAGWASVATGASPAAMQDALLAGEAACLLGGAGDGDRRGHMAIVQRPRSIEYDAAGEVQRIVFDGWEAQPNGAKHLTERAWNRAGHAGEPGDRNGLTRIEIIRLNRAEPGAAERPVSDTAKSSRLDSVSSNEGQRPTQGGKEHS
jgi:Rod binding domain-containing protein